MNQRHLVPLYQEEAGGEGERPEEAGNEAAQSEAGHDVGEAVRLYGVNIRHHLTRISQCVLEIYIYATNVYIIYTSLRPGGFE